MSYEYRNNRFLISVATIALSVLSIALLSTCRFLRPAPDKSTLSPTVTFQNGSPTASASASSATPIFQGSSPTTVFSVTHASLVSENGTQKKYIGILHNRSDVIQANVRVMLEISENAGTQRVTRTVPIFLPLLTPGESSPFAVNLDDVPTAEVDHLSLKAITADTIETSNDSVLVEENHSMVIDDGGHAYVIGTLTNNGAEPVAISEIAGAILDENSNLLDVALASTGTQIIWPGDKAPFRISFARPSLPKSDQELVYFSATEVEQPSAVQVKTVEQESGALTFVDTFGLYHLGGEVVNIGDRNVLVWLNAALYSQDGELLDVSQTSVPLFVLAPGERQPFDFNDFPIVSNSIPFGNRVARYRITVNQRDSQAVDVAPIVLEGKEIDWDANTGLFNIRGEVENSSSENLQAIIIAILVRDEVGAIVGTGHQTLFRLLPSKETLDFQFAIPIDPHADANLLNPEVQIQGLATVP